MYVSNRLALLNLAPELRDVVDTKQIKVKTAEKIAKIQDPEQQKAIAAEEIRKAREPKASRTRRTTPPAPPVPVQNPVLNPGAAPGTTSGGAVAIEVFNADSPAIVVPEPRPTMTPEADMTAAEPWHDGAAFMDAAFDKLDPIQRSAFILRYFHRSRGVESVIADMRGELAPQDRASLAAILQQVAAGLLRDA
ncbi:hypothetical protein [Streptomyces sp. NPDC047985]|uniref:hypothetical protein n=1 Tax=Streptomyces sp. NPDC047985 TaxID=3155384 RepID=UPI003417A112